MSLLLQGRCGFEDMFLPVKGKVEWGMDTLTRRLSGARSLLPAFVAGLTQGDIFEDYFLQTWEPDDNPDKGEITLNYKGLFTEGTPLPDIQSEMAPASGSISRNYSGENNGLGRVYRKLAVYAFNPNPGEEDAILGYRSIYTTGVTMQFTYDAIQTTYRYIVLGKPDRPKFYGIDIPRTPTVKEVKIITADGAVYGKNGPFNDLEPDIITTVVGFVSKNVIGTPYYECQDVVRRELGEYDSGGPGSFGP